VDVKGFTLSHRLGFGACISIQSLGSDGWSVIVCSPAIADAVAKGSSDDLSALSRVRSKKITERSFSSLVPRRIVEGSCRIQTGKSKTALAARARIGPKGNIASPPYLCLCRAESVKEYSCEELFKAAEKPKDFADDQVLAAMEIASRLSHRRRTVGQASVIYDGINGIVVSADESDSIITGLSKPEVFSRMIFQEISIFASEVAASFARIRGIPSIFSMWSPGRVKSGDRRKPYSVTGEGGPETFMPISDPANYYASLVNQRQMMSFLRRDNTLPYGNEELKSIVKKLGPALTESEYARMGRRRSPVEAASPNAFSKILQAELNIAKQFDSKEEFSQEIYQEAKSRAREKKLLPKDIFNIIESPMREPWDSFRRMIFFDEDFADGKSPLTILSMFQDNGSVKGLKFMVERKRSEKGSLEHHAIVKSDHPKIHSEEFSDRKKQKAKALAAHSFLKKSLRLKKDSSESMLSVDKAQDVTRSFEADPVGSLYEHCLKMGHSPPEFSYKIGGAKNLSFVSSCTAMGLSAMSSPMRSKKLAKKEAALRAVRLLRERDPSRFV